MAVQNYSTNYGTSGYNPTQDTSGVPENWALQGHGVKKRYVQQTISAAATDSNGSTYLLIKDIPADAILNRCDLEVDANTGGTSYSIGLYGGTGNNQGVVISAGCYMSAVDIHAGTTPALSSMIDGLQALTHENRLAPVWSVAGDTLLTKKGSYDLVLTANTAASTAFKLTAHMEILDNG